MMNCAIIGYGELGQQLHRFIIDAYAPEKVVFFDDGCVERQQQGAVPFADYLSDKYADYAFFIGLGYKQLAAKARILKELQEADRQLPSLVHPTAWVAPTAQIGEAVYIYPQCNIDKEVELRPGALLNNSVTVSHNSVVGPCSYLSPGVVLCGFVSIGHNSFLGAGTLVSNNIAIGNEVVTGIGSVVAQPVPDGSHCIGNPLKLLSQPIQLI
jgi:sugar O-acyltransferase (sialic acid O-acetyltransferase NeuD family)